MKKEVKLDLRESIKRLNLTTNKIVNTKIVGGYKSVFRGRGLEFNDYRHYTPDDDASFIDWRASVRSKELLIKEFTEERNLSVFFLIDVSSSMVYSSTDRLKIEYSAEIISTLAYTIIHSGDSIGFAIFKEGVSFFEPPRTGFKQFYNLNKTLVNPNIYGGRYDIVRALEFTMAFLKEFSIVIIVSDFIGLKGDWQHWLKAVGKKHDLIGIMVRDPRDRELPNYKGNVVFNDLFSDKQIMVNVESIKEKYKSYVESTERDISSAFLESNSELISLSTDQPFVKPLMDFFLRRAKIKRVG